MAGWEIDERWEMGYRGKGSTYKKMLKKEKRRTAGQKQIRI